MYIVHSTGDFNWNTWKTWRASLVIGYMYNDFYMISVDLLCFQATTEIAFQDQTKEIHNGAGSASDMPPFRKDGHLIEK